MSEVTIKVRDSGPLLVTGPVTIVDAEGNRFTVPTGKPAIALCRCGQSKNKPFCDGTHRDCNFVATERAQAGEQGTSQKGEQGTSQKGEQGTSQKGERGASAP